MDEMDFIQDLILERQAASLLAVREAMEAEKRIVPPKERKCSDCGGSIPQARLKLKPMTHLCVDCQSDSERLNR